MYLTEAQEPIPIVPLPIMVAFCQMVRVSIKLEISLGPGGRPTKHYLPIDWLLCHVKWYEHACRLRNCLLSCGPSPCVRVLKICLFQRLIISRSWKILSKSDNFLSYSVHKRTDKWIEKTHKTFSIVKINISNINHIASNRSILLCKSNSEQQQSAQFYHSCGKTVYWLLGIFRVSNSTAIIMSTAECWGNY